MPAEIQRFASFFLSMDPPQHTVYRRLISSAFTPRNVRQIEEQIHRNAVSIVDDLVGAGDIEFVAACSARLPMLTIMDMLGVPSADQPAVAYAAEKLFGMSDDEYSTPEERAQDPVAQITAALQHRCGVGEVSAREPRRRPDDQHRQRRGRRTAADRRGDRRVPDSACLGRQRHHQADDNARDDGVGRQPRPARLADGGLREPYRACRRGIRSLVVAGHTVRTVRRPTTPRSTGNRSPQGTRSACSTARPTATKPSSTVRVLST